MDIKRKIKAIPAKLRTVLAVLKVFSSIKISLGFILCPPLFLKVTSVPYVSQIQEFVKTFLSLILKTEKPGNFFKNQKVLVGFLKIQKSW